MSVSRDIAINSVGKLIPPLLALATQPLLALGLGAAGRGELAAATAPLMLVTTILTFGVPDAFTHYLARRVGGQSRLLGAASPFSCSPASWDPGRSPPSPRCWPRARRVSQRSS